MHSPVNIYYLFRLVLGFLNIKNDRCEENSPIIDLILSLSHIHISKSLKKDSSMLYYIYTMSSTDCSKNRFTTLNESENNNPFISKNESKFTKPVSTRWSNLSSEEDDERPTWFT